MSHPPIHFHEARVAARPSGAAAGRTFCRALIVPLLAVSLFGLSACGVSPVRSPGTPTVSQPTTKGAVKPVRPPSQAVTTPTAPPGQGESVLPSPPATAQDLTANGSPRLEPVPDSPLEEASPLAVGLASWYGKRFHGRRTANGERFDMHALTAAHRSLPFGTRLRVRSITTGREVVVRINDRGPYRGARILDLSFAAARALGVDHLGVTRVEIHQE